MTDLGEFLRACRARVSAEQVGLPTSGHRRVPGLRREELASLAGVSVDYVVRLEQGRVKSASPAILTALARALGLRPDEEEYLLRCAAEAGISGGTKSAATRKQQVPQATRVLLDSMVNVPALVLGRRMDILAWNSLSAALFTDYSQLPAKQRNHIWLTFLAPEVRGLYENWEKVAQECVAYLRMDAGRYPNDPELARLVGELSMKDPDFRRWWSDHRVRAQRPGRKEFVHAVAGELSLDFQVLDLRSATDQSLLVYTAEPNSASEQALTFLAGWAATETPTPAAEATGSSRRPGTAPPAGDSKEQPGAQGTPPAN
ncbi:helix-turn-helix domain-containing protein [Streptomyces sp. NPDC052721]|uniref:helix-turn-helix transcriptional regulator n=1 Tax=Streptomyces sp. NPDC052721 TaxID=3154955 RepID=UPI003415D4A8